MPDRIEVTSDDESIIVYIPLGFLKCKLVEAWWEYKRNKSKIVLDDKKLIEGVHEFLVSYDYDIENYHASPYDSSIETTVVSILLCLAEENKAGISDRPKRKLKSKPAVAE